MLTIAMLAGVAAASALGCSERVKVDYHLPPASTTSDYVAELERPHMPLPPRQRPKTRARRDGSAPPDPAPSETLERPSLPEPPDCAAIERCIRRSVSPRYHPAAFPAAALERCVGATRREQWDARQCFPIPLGRDVRNHRRVEVVVKCSDICPAQAGMWARYADIRHAECLCLGGGPVGLWPYRTLSGCKPVDGPSYNRSPRHPFDREIWGFRSVDDVLYINGEPPSAEQRQRFTERPRDLPQSIEAVGKRIRFVRQSEIARLWRATPAEYFPRPEGFEPGCSTEGDASEERRGVIKLEGRPFPFYAGCADAQNRRLADLAVRFKDVFEGRSGPQPPSEDVSCVSLRSKPFIYSLSEPGGGPLYEIRFIDWLPPRTEKMREMLAKRRERRQ